MIYYCKKRKMHGTTPNHHKLQGSERFFGRRTEEYADRYLFHTGHFVLSQLLHVEVLENALQSVQNRF